MLSITIWWFVDARKWFKGPKINVEHHMVEHAKNIVEGVEVEEKSAAHT